MALDMNDTYFHVDIHPTSRHFLRVMVGSNHYQYWVFPFGIVTAPRAFTKIFSIVAAHVKHPGFIVFPCFDDLLPVTKSRQEAYASTSIALCLPSSLGVSVDTEKSVLTPTQSLDFSGATLNSITARTYLPKNRFQTMNNIIVQVTNNPSVLVKICLSLLCHMASCTYATPFARHHFRCLQTWLQLVNSANHHPMNLMVTVLVKVASSLLCWTNPNPGMSGHLLSPFLS